MFRKKRTWIFLTLAIAALWGGYVLFYKSTPKNIATNTADAVVVIDVKRILQTGIWEYITHPSRWKIDWSTDDSKDTLVNWKDAIRLPDYITIFHEKGQDWGIWHTQLYVKDQEDFTRLMAQEKFERVATNIFVSDSLNLTITQDKDRIFLSSTSQKSEANAVHSKLQNNKEDINESIWTKLKAKGKHISLYFAKGSSLQNDAFASLHYGNNKIELDGNATPLAPYAFNNVTYSVSKDEMVFAVLSQPKFDIAKILDSSAQNKFKNILNISPESTLLPSNESYSFRLQKFAEKIDTAVSYTYDDDFNAIEKKEITKNIEPVFGINIKGPKTDSILNSWRQQKVIENNAKGDLFTSIPFAKSYCTIGSGNLSIATTDYTGPQLKQKEASIFHVLVDVKKLYPNIEKYLPANLKEGLSKTSSIEVKVVGDEKNNISLEGIFNVSIW